MGKKGIVLATDRGGHLHNALMLIGQMQCQPAAIITTYGPDIDSLRKTGTPIFAVAHLFSWIGKLRLPNPINLVRHVIYSGVLAFRLKPRAVISVGASNVVIFCYWARLFGAEIYHVECMNQVVSPSITGKMLYPISEKVFVQWKELLPVFGPKAEYAGWVL